MATEELIVAAAAAAAAPTTATPNFRPPPILDHAAAAPTADGQGCLLVAQGAEGRLYKTTFLRPSLPCALKYRPPKEWRHPVLDQRLTRHRILSEARILVKCRREGVRVPAVYALDEAAGWLMLEWIPGAPVRARINRWLAGRPAEAIEHDGRLGSLVRRMGEAIGRLHAIGIVHGDLTTSNMMLQPQATLASPPDDASGRPDSPDTALDGEVVIIDLGLASGSIQDEDRAVDLYVLERAFGSTHPRAECLFGLLLDAYRSAYPHAPGVLKKLEAVRQRGRKRSMLG